MNILHNDDARLTLGDVEYHAVTSQGLCVYRGVHCALEGLSARVCAAARCIPAVRNDGVSIIWVKAVP